MNVLVLGSDTRTNDYTSGRADFIRAMRLDFHNETIRMLSVPRDLWVPIPGLADRGVYESRIDEAYAYGNYFELPGLGPSLMADTLNLNLGLTFDHYVVVNFAAVEAGIDAIGGLDIDLPEDIDGTHQGFPYFKAGPNHMDGKTLVQYVRIRYIDNDLYRIDRQNQVLLALREKLLSPNLVPALPDLIAAMTKLINTDLSPAQLSEMICLGRRVGLDQFDSLKIGETEVTPFTAGDGRLALLPRFDAIELVLKIFLAEGDSIG
jgi:LCP family protein required for cell wall assembly